MHKPKNRKSLASQDTRLFVGKKQKFMLYSEQMRGWLLPCGVLLLYA